MENTGVQRTRAHPPPKVQGLRVQGRVASGENVAKESFTQLKYLHSVVNYCLPHETPHSPSTSSGALQRSLNCC